MNWRNTVLLLLLTGCGPIGGCPEAERFDVFMSGTFSSPNGAPWEELCVGCGTIFQPHDGVTDLTMDLDLQQNVAIISYTRDGQAIEERWRITGRSDR